MNRTSNDRWLIIRTRTDDGFVHDVYRQHSKTLAVRDAIEDYEGTPQYNTLKDALETTGSFTDGGTRVTVREVQGT